MNDFLLPPSLKMLKTQYFCYSNNANKINPNICKNQNIPNRYLPVQSQQKNSRTSCVNCSKLTKKTPERLHWDGDIKKHWRCSGVFIVNFKKIPHLFLVFDCLPGKIKVQTSKNYETFKDRYKLCHINHTDQTKAWKETCIKF